VVARGDQFPDALAAGPESYTGSSGPCGDNTPLPLLLTASDSLSPSAASALTDLNVKQVLLMGGTAAITTATEDAIKAMGINVIRIGGVNRQETVIKLSTIAAEQIILVFDIMAIIYLRGD